MQEDVVKSIFGFCKAKAGNNAKIKIGKKVFLEKSATVNVWFRMKLIGRGYCAITCADEVGA